MFLALLPHPIPPPLVGTEFCFSSLRHFAFAAPEKNSLYVVAFYEVILFYCDKTKIYFTYAYDN